MWDVAHRAIGLFVGGHFLAVQRNGHRMRLGPCGLNQGDRFAHRSAGADHVIHNQHATLQGGPDQRAAFAMVFGLFAVVGKRHVLAQTGQLDGHGHTQGDALVRRAKYHVELDATGDEGLCIELGQLTQLGTIVEQACVKKVGRQASGLGLEFTKAQHA